MRQLLRLKSSFALSVRERIRQERETRLSKGPDAHSLTTRALDDIGKIRNIGIIAHIDAGKTTTTERMLYYAGALPSPGNIDEGTTTMDYLAQERERGITIRSAAISFNWNDSQLNLIDTPGHVDFSGQVYRSLRVLDGVVTILDGAKGVESQTLKVWAQASRFNLPKICYINKMDRIGASYKQAVESMVKKLDIVPLVLQYPVGDGDTFRGVVDILELEEVLFLGAYGEDVRRTRIAKNTEKHNLISKLREQLVETVGNFDEKIGDMYLNEQYVPSAQLKQAIRNIVATQPHHKLTPILMGTSYKNKGVQPLLDAIVSYLPSPLEREPIKSADGVQFAERGANKTDPLTGYVFKVLFDLEKGPLSYARIYSGEATKSFDIYNSSKRVPEKIGQILRVRANQYVPINQITAGDIVALSGLRETTAGDTFTMGSDEFVLQNLEVPKPIFTAPFEVTDGKQQREFDEAMRKAVIEDTSLSYQFESETNQYLVSGLGQLHLEILRDRLISDKIPVSMGNLKINFKETVGKEAQDSFTIKKEVKPNQLEYFQISMRIRPLRNSDGGIEARNEVIFDFERVPEFDVCWAEFIKKKKLSKDPRAASALRGEMHKMKKNVRNPTPIQPLYEEEEEEGEDEDNLVEYNDDDESEDEEFEQKKTGKVSHEDELYYHMNTLPFETLYELVEACQTSLLYGKKRMPAMGIQLLISGGKYKKSSFSKSVMNKCASSLTRNLIQKTSTLIEPIMEFQLSGDEAMIEVALKDVLRKRGRVNEQTENSLSGVIPAVGVRGWIKQLRSMGLQIDLKFLEYEEVIGVGPDELLEQNI